MENIKQYIDNGIPISYIIILKARKLFEFFRWGLSKIGFSKYGLNFKIRTAFKGVQRKKMRVGNNVLFESF